MQMLAIEVLKTVNDINPSYMKNIFTLRVNPRIRIRPIWSDIIFKYKSRNITHKIQGISKNMVRT